MPAQIAVKMALMPDVAFYEAFEEEETALRHLLPARIAAIYTDKTIQESGDAAPPGRLISIRTQSQLPPAWAPQLGGILARATGYDHLLAYAAAVPIAPALGYLPLYCQRAVAEQAALMWMALMRRLPRQLRQFGQFHRDGLTGLECAGRTLVVVGVGNIGYEVCKIGQGLGMRVLGVDLQPRFADVEFATIDAALPQADVLVCAMDLNKGNHGFFDTARWQQVKLGAIFVNISRGELSPAGALLEALDVGQLGGVGLDVFNHEPALATALRTQGSFNDPEVNATLILAQRDDCICTPHNAFNTAEAVARKSEHSVQQVMAFLETGQFLWTPPRVACPR